MVYPFAVNIRDIVRFDQISALCGAVSAERQARIARFRFDKDKIRCLTAELLVRYALSVQFGMDLGSAAFQCAENGKPLLVDSDVHFNLSHSGEWVVCAVGKTEIGIDVEEIRQTDYQDIYCSFAEPEIARLNSTEPDRKADVFYQLWTLKESYVKYCGSGLRCPFSDFTVELLPDGSAKLARAAAGVSDICFDSRKLDAAHWYALCIPDGTQAAAICTVTPQRVFSIVK
ncbi:MAG: 4'-phosphopantetheinyl transferase superfamily protein [Oscillospiraceae bacterium]|nr:4'-phosphopantetheinyl transferase superfamily protein [Oscillospiraceae bacterium]